MRAWVVVGVLAFAAGVAGADAAAPSPAPRKLIVATHEAPPFIIKGADGSFSGISIDLWRHFADTLHLDYESAQREKEMDLTHAVFGSARSGCSRRSSS